MLRWRLRANSSIRHAFLREIEASDPSFAGLADSKTRAGGCPVIDNTAEILKEKYEQAKSLMNDARYPDALEILKNIQAKDPNYLDTARLQKRAEKAIAEERRKSAVRRTAKPEPQGEAKVQKEEPRKTQKKEMPSLKPLPEQPDEAKVQKEEPRTAQSKEVPPLTPQPEPTSPEQPKVEPPSISAEEEILLLSGMDSFYVNDYLQARQSFDNFRKGIHPPKLLALACFYLGATAISEFYLTGASDQQKKKEGMLLFEQAQQHYQDFSPPWNALSPKIRAAYTEATGRKP
jgi:hypothetical protein